MIYFLIAFALLVLAAAIPSPPKHRTTVTFIWFDEDKPRRLP